MSEQHPIMTVVGIRKSEGSFKDDNGRSIDYSNTVVTVLQPFSEDEIKNGANGMKAIEHKIKGAQFYHDYQNQALPADAQLIFHWDFSKKTPKANLVALDFKYKKSS